MRQEFGARYSLIYTVALIVMGATTLFSCSESIDKTDAIGSADSLSTLTVYEMNGVQSAFGKVNTRLEAPRMENYSLLPDPFEIFPQGIKISGYTPEGVLESEITAQRAIHKTGNRERWEGYGNVVIINFIKGERVETDTLYWDSAAKKIYTHAFIRYYAPDGFIQGYGMESDENADNIVVLHPFYSYAIIRDTTNRASAVPVDSVETR
ncbi:MAG: LPS export ABC transporter periplasmic protein LptC [Bacteroidetes bacterium]|nr:LPS export ABC transporter periplasmic protein LptC [Bacteroidota bacterium]